MAIDLLKWYVTEKAGDCHAWGYVSGHPEIAEGKWIHTSQIVKAEENTEKQCLMAETASGNIYCFAKKEIHFENMETTRRFLIKFGLPEFCRDAVEAGFEAEQERQSICRHRLAENELFLEMLGCSCLAAYFKDAGGVHPLDVDVHVGTFQDSVLCRKAGIADFRFFPQGDIFPIMETYHASNNIQGVLVKNLGRVDISLDSIACKAKAMTRVDKKHFTAEGLLSPDVYDGKCMLFGGIDEG